MKEEHADFIKSRFDLLLVTLLVLTFAAMAIHAYHGQEKDLAAFAVDTCKLFSGALLAMITQRAVRARTGDPEAPVGTASPTSGSKPAGDAP